MRIGGIGFALRSREPMRLAEPPPVYGEFLFRSGSEAGGDEIAVDIETGPGPAFDEGQKIFDTGEAWSLYRFGDDYCLTLRPPALGGEAVWSARFHPAKDAVTLYCGERLVRRERGGPVVGSPFCYPLDQMLMMYLLATRSGLCLHAAGAVVATRGCAFPGRSGAGKSTVARGLTAVEGTRLLSDDRVILRARGGAFDLYGTPWAGEARVAVNGCAGLAGLFFLRQSERDGALRLAPGEALEELLPVVSVPWYDEQYRDIVLGHCERLVATVPAWILEFSLGGPAGRTVAEAFRALEGTP